MSQVSAMEDNENKEFHSKVNLIEETDKEWVIKKFLRLVQPNNH